MAKWRFATSASAASLGLVLAAPASAANDDLVGSLTSESFANVASYGTLEAPVAGNEVATAAGTLTLGISYNAANRAYTVNDGTRTRTFRPIDIDASRSNAQVTTYRIVAGSTTDTLSLTTTGTGAGQTRYVAAGLWQRQVNGANSVDGRFEAFAYGVKTADGALPRTGYASFDVSLLGTETFQKLVYALGGSGKIAADLAAGAIVGAGTYSRTNVQTGTTENGFAWGMAAFLSANSNNFSGRIALGSIDGAGEVHGSFFGPAAQEVGASFSANPDEDTLAVGTIVGTRNADRINQVTSLAIPENPVFYRPLAASARGTLNAQGNLSAVRIAPRLLRIYNAAGGAGLPQFFSADGREMGTYVPAGQEQGFRVLASSNVAFGLVLDKRPTLGQLDTFVYGFDTLAASLPRTGTGTFDVAMQGGVLAPGAALQSLEGYGALKVNFGSGAITTAGRYTVSSATPVLQSYSSGRVTDRGIWAGNATLSATANAFSGTITLNGRTDYSGTLAGKFFGTGASEVGGVINALAADGGRAVAAIAGMRGTGVGASTATLSGATRSIRLQGSTAQLDTVPVFTPSTFAGVYGPVEITYNPATKTYVFTATRPGSFGSAVKLSRTFTEAQRNAAASNATFASYSAPGVTARFFNPGPDNPRIALTYTSFADITENVTVAGNATTARHFVPFGIQTPNFQMPRTGTASYSGVVYGAGRYGTVAPQASLSGNSQFNVNFGTGAASMQLALTATQNSTNHALGSFTYSGVLGSGCPGGCDTNGFQLVTTTGGASGFMDGKFFGPNAAEFGAAFTLNLPPTVAGNAATGSTFAGVTVGKKD